jgi:peptidoglycan/LPS O-acetylase OafA/YrhL
MGLIRFLLAWAVVIAHFTYFPTFRLIGGELAVEGFFIISGFYISMILNDQYSSTKNFLINRFLRLYPAYALIAAINLTVNLINPGELKNIFELPLVLSSYLIFTNATMMFQDVAMFLGVQNGHLHFVSNFLNSSPVIFRYLLIPQAWTLGIEISFYLIAPLLFLKRNQYIYLIFILSITVRIYLLNHGKADDPWSYRFFPSELALFMLGAISHAIYSKINFDQNSELLLEIGKFMLALIVSFVIFFPNISAQYELKKGVFYLLLAIGIPFVFNLCKENKFDRFIGELSYPIYLLWTIRISPVDAIIQHLQISSENTKGLIFYSFLLISAILIHLMIEKPFEKIRNKFRNKAQVNVTSQYK